MASASLDREELPWQNDSDRYEELGSLGSGAYGTVYRVRHRVTGQEFALKKIRVRLSEEGIPQNVVREISTLKSIQHIQHPNVARLIDVSHGLMRETELYINVIFEKCDWDLYDFLQRIPSDLPEVQVRTLARQMISGIDFLHNQNIVHRDLKPQNILVNRDMTVKLADFGLARSYSMHSAFTTIVVTLWYRSPEVLLQCSYDSAVDLWSFGCILAELYVRRALFPGQTETQQLSLILQVIGTPPHVAWPANALVSRSNFPSWPGVPLERILTRTPHDGLFLIKQLLQFSASDRPSAREVLSSTYFSNGDTRSDIEE